MLLVFCTLAVLSIAGETAVELEAKAEEKKAADSIEAAQALLSSAGERRLKDAAVILPSKPTDELSLDADASDDELTPDGGAADTRTYDGAVRNYLQAARDFEDAGRPRSADDALGRAEKLTGASAAVKKEASELRKEFEQARTAGEPPDKVWKRRAVTDCDLAIREVEAAKAEKKVSPAKVAACWDKVAMRALREFRVDDLRKADAAMKDLPEKAAPDLGIWRPAVAAYDRFAAFPRPEEELATPRDLAALGVKDMRTVVAGELDWDAEDATACVEEALASGATTVVFENRGSPWYVRTIRPRSGQRLVFKKGVKILKDRVSRQNGDVSDVILIKNVANVILEGEGGADDVFIGTYADVADKRQNCKKEGGSALTLDGARGIVVRNLTLGCASCDGITFTGVGTPNRDVWLENVNLRDNYRLAMSGSNVFGLCCRRVSFTGTSGGSVGCGIDFEPTYEIQANADMYFLDCRFADNDVSAVNFSSSSYYPVSALFRRCMFEGERGGYGIVIFARPDPYYFARVKAPGKVVFEDCVQRIGGQKRPVYISNTCLFDIVFRNHRLIETEPHAKQAGAPVFFNLLWESRHTMDYATFPDELQGSLLLDGFHVTGFEGAPRFRSVNDGTGWYPVPHVSGWVEWKGERRDAAQYAYAAPERSMNLVEIPRFDPADYEPPAAPAKRLAGLLPEAFAFDWRVNWFDTPPAYYVLHPQDGRWQVRRIPRGLREPMDVNAPVAYYCRSSDSVARLLPRTSGKETVVYFEVPSGKEVSTIKVVGGSPTLKDAAGNAVVRPEGSRYFRFASASGKPEVWSISFNSRTAIKFFAPLNGIFAESPDALPRRRISR